MLVKDCDGVPMRIPVILPTTIPQPHAPIGIAHSEIAFFGEHERHAVQQILAVLHQPVYLMLFMPSADDEYGLIIQDFLETFVEMHPDLHLEVYDTQNDMRLALSFGIGRLPAIMVRNAEGDENNIRFYGLPSGYTFSALLDTVLRMGGVESISLTKPTRTFLGHLKHPLHIQIFVSAENRACPAMVALAHSFAHFSRLIVVDTIEVRAFPELVECYAVMRTPTLVVNGRVMLVVPDAVNEAILLQCVRSLAV